MAQNILDSEDKLEERNFDKFLKIKAGYKLITVLVITISSFGITGWMIGFVFDIIACTAILAFVFLGGILTQIICWSTGFLIKSFRGRESRLMLMDKYSAVLIFSLIVFVIWLILLFA